MFKHILVPVELVPVDLAVSSGEALGVALELAKSLGAKITLVHVHQPQAAFYPGAFPVPVPDFDKAVLEAAQTALDALVERVREKIPSATAMLRTGSPWEAIIDAAKECGAGLIVIGTHGRTGLPRALLGSVAEKVVRMSPIPVLTVHGA